METTRGWEDDGGNAIPDMWGSDVTVASLQAAMDGHGALRTAATVGKALLERNKVDEDHCIDVR